MCQWLAWWLACAAMLDEDGSCVRPARCPHQQATEQEMMVREQLKNDIEDKIRFQLRQEYKVRAG